MNTDLPTPVFAACLGVLALTALGTLPVVGHPLGSDWGHYFTAAEYIWDPVPGIAYPDFRKPWFGWLIGGIGQGVGYFHAAQWVSRFALVVMVCSTGLLGAALASRWVGLSCAVTMLLMPLAMDGSLWVNHYPLLGAAVGLAFAAGAAAMRGPWLGWVLLAGLASGVAWALDFRGVVAAPAAGGLVFLGGIGLSLRRLMARLLLFVAVAAGPMTHDIWLQETFSVPQLRPEAQLEVQRAGTLAQVQQGLVGGDRVREACSSEATTAFTVSASMGDCATALRDSSWMRLNAMGHVPGGIPLLAGLAWLLPVGLKRRWLGAIAGAGILGAPLASLYLGMGWVTYFDRYVLPFAVIIAALLPVAAGRLTMLIPVPKIAAPLGAVLGVLASVVVWPGLTARSLEAPEAVRSSEYHAGVFAGWARSQLAQGDAVIDCAGLAVDSLLLPNRIDYVRFPPGDEACVALIQAPPLKAGKVFLITMHRDIPPHARRDALPFSVEAVAAEGWVEAEHGLDVDGFRLWVRK